MKNLSLLFLALSSFTFVHAQNSTQSVRSVTLKGNLPVGHKLELTMTFVPTVNVESLKKNDRKTCFIWQKSDGASHSGRWTTKDAVYRLETVSNAQGKYSISIPFQMLSSSICKYKHPSIYFLVSALTDTYFPNGRGNILNMKSDAQYRTVPSGSSENNVVCTKDTKDNGRILDCFSQTPFDNNPSNIIMNFLQVKDSINLNFIFNNK